MVLRASSSFFIQGSLLGAICGAGGGTWVSMCKASILPSVLTLCYLSGELNYHPLTLSSKNHNCVFSGLTPGYVQGSHLALF